MLAPAAEPFEVLIPARGDPAVLAPTLAALRIALEGAGAPARVRILVNGSPRAMYRQLQLAYAEHDWQFSRSARGYHAAIVRLLRSCVRPWVYLLNSDMQLEPDALAHVLALRGDGIFSIATQIRFADRQRRREETGFTAPVLDGDGRLQLHDLVPPDCTVRSHLYGGGGATLFRADFLRRFLRRSRAYAPFYFEDADWGMQAWAEGLECLFCPMSRAVHQHRATISAHFSSAQIEAIVARNLDHFRWRYGDVLGGPLKTEHWSEKARSTLRAISLEHNRARSRVLSCPGALAIRYAHLRRTPRWPRFRQHLPRVLLVSPFDLFPPAHGGARRIVELARASADRIDWIALHDEASPVPRATGVEEAAFREIIPVRGRPDDGDARWAAHAHTALRAALMDAIMRHRPDVLGLEHVECIGLIDDLPAGLPVLWTLHDAGRSLAEAERHCVQAALRRVDTLVLTTAADLGYWGHRHECLVENGARFPEHAISLPDSGAPLLLVAPLRYRPNLDGLRAFLKLAWPELSDLQPLLRLRVLGGTGARYYWGEAELPDGVELIDEWVDPGPHYASCALALNPQTVIEGSALKIAEALAHGRVVVSTEAGARGYEALDSAALVRVSDVRAMADAIRELIRAPERLREASRCAQSAAMPWSWEQRGIALAELLESMAVNR